MIPSPRYSAVIFLLTFMVILLSPTLSGRLKRGFATFRSLPFYYHFKPSYAYTPAIESATILTYIVVATAVFRVNVD